MRRSALSAALVGALLVVAADAAAQERVPDRSCSGSICVDAIERGDTVVLRARNTGKEAREVSVLLVVVNGYANPLGDQNTVTVAGGGEATALTLVPTPPQGGRPRGYRYLFDSQLPLADACRRGACFRTLRTAANLTISVHNVLTVPLVIATNIDGATPDTVQVEAETARAVFTTWARALTPRRGLRIVRLASPPDTLFAYEAPVAGRVTSTGLPELAARALAADTSASTARTLAQNLHAYVFDTREAEPVAAARSGVVIEVADSVTGRIDVPPITEGIVVMESTGPPPPDGSTVALTRRPGPVINHVFVRHDDGTLARYLGLAQASAAVAVGDRVAAGDPIARVAQDGFFSFSVVRVDDPDRTLPVSMRLTHGAVKRLAEGDAVGQ